MIAKLVSNQFHVEVPKLLPEFELWQDFWKFRVLEPRLSKLVGRVEPFQCPLSYFSHYTSKRFYV